MMWFDLTIFFNIRDPLKYFSLHLELFQFSAARFTIKNRPPTLPILHIFFLPNLSILGNNAVNHSRPKIRRCPFNGSLIPTESRITQGLRGHRGLSSRARNKLSEGSLLYRGKRRKREEEDDARNICVRAEREREKRRLGTTMERDWGRMENSGYASPSIRQRFDTRDSSLRTTTECIIFRSPVDRPSSMPFR